MASQTRGQNALAGQTLSHYRIVEKIGAGGMGEVFRAYDQHLDRDVAIKVLPPGTLGDESARKRFRKEALALSRLNHPNIATIHDFDIQQGVDFLVMEYVPGITLSEKLAAGPLPEKEVVALGTQLAEGLSAAHEHGVVHRDLKPSNLRLTADGRLKILDFGLAKLWVPVTASAATKSLSETQGIAGTLPYMAPEQLLGGEIDARTDIHAIGSVLYEMAAGQPPFSELPQGQLIGAILQSAPAPPRQLNPKISPELDRIIGKCLENEPENRYQSSNELAIDLRRLHTGSQGTLLVTTLHSVPAYVKSMGLGLGILALLIVLLLTLKIGLWRNHGLGRADAPRIESVAVLPLENLSGDPQQEYFADGMTESLITDLGRLTGLKGVIARGSVMRYKGTKAPLSEIARDLKVDAIITGAVLRSGNRVRITAQLIEPESGEQLWTERYERDLSDVLRLQNEVTSAIAGEIRVKLTENEQAQLTSVRSVNPQAYDAYLMGRFHWYKMTPQALDTAAKYFQIALDRDPNYAPAYAGIGEVWMIRAHTGLLPVAEGYAKARAAAVKALELDSMLPEAHEALAGALTWYEWDWGSGEKEYRRAIELNPNYAQARCFYSFFLHAMRRSQEARAQIEQALELDPYNSVFHMALGMQFIDEHQPDDGLVSLQRAAALQPDSLFVHGDLWFAFAQRNEYEKAQAEAKQYFTLLGAQDVVQALDRGYAQSGYREAMRLAADTLAGNSKRSHISTMDVALLYTYAGEYDRALDWLEKAYLEHASRLPYINVLAPWDPLRSQPRFQDLVRRMNFPP
jgi:serine/threonine protein kinase/tetratricopeptide (TPR) repeat protein